jgi:hypothetical protein
MSKAEITNEILSLYDLSIICFENINTYIITYITRNITPNITRVITRNITRDITREKRVIFCMIWFVITLFFSPCFKVFFKMSHIAGGLIGFITTYQIYYIYGTKLTGQPSWGMLKYSGWHIHHWFYCVNILVILLLLLDTVHPIIIGLCFGGIVHGIQFSDWYNFKDNKKESHNVLIKYPLIPPSFSEKPMC